MKKIGVLLASLFVLQCFSACTLLEPPQSSTQSSLQNSSSEFSFSSSSSSFVNSSFSSSSSSTTSSSSSSLEIVPIKGTVPLYVQPNGIELTSDPYKNVNKTSFYKNYTVATSNSDAYYRSQNALLSGENVVPDQAPMKVENQPKYQGKYVRNSVMRYSLDGNAYTVTDVNGEPVFTVYKDGAYITLEEVAAYVYAFGTFPKNHVSKKSTKPTKSVWGEYLRLNHSYFSGDTDNYPYEPILPNIDGCGGTLQYYEMDVGTTGTDCDPSYTSTLYNNGSTITRGAARIVYGKADLNGNGVYERGEFHLFYTYNHYNDFQEYLNYYGGWGEMFGNITGGGTISSKSDYNPTDYPEIVFAPLS